MTDRVYAAKEWMNEAYRIRDSELRIKEEYAERIKPDDGAIDYSKDRIQNDSSSVQEEKLLTYTMILQDIDKIKTKMEKVKRTRMRAINMLEDSTERAILFARYIDFMEFKQIGHELGYARTELHKKHVKALDHLYDFIKEVEE